LTGEKEEFSNSERGLGEESWKPPGNFKGGLVL